MLRILHIEKARVDLGVGGGGGVAGGRRRGVGEVVVGRWRWDCSKGKGGGHNTVRTTRVTQRDEQSAGGDWRAGKIGFVDLASFQLSCTRSAHLQFCSPLATVHLYVADNAPVESVEYQHENQYVPDNPGDHQGIGHWIHCRRRGAVKG